MDRVLHGCVNREVDHAQNSESVIQTTAIAALQRKQRCDSSRDFMRDGRSPQTNSRRSEDALTMMTACIESPLPPLLPLNAHSQEDEYPIMVLD